MKDSAFWAIFIIVLVIGVTLGIAYTNATITGKAIYDIFKTKEIPTQTIQSQPSEYNHLCIFRTYWLIFEDNNTGHNICRTASWGFGEFGTEYYQSFPKCIFVEGYRITQYYTSIDGSCSGASQGSSEAIANYDETPCNVPIYREDSEGKCSFNNAGAEPIYGDVWKKIIYKVACCKSSI